MSLPSNPLNIEVYDSITGTAFFEQLIAEWRAADANVTVCGGVPDASYRAPKRLAGRLLLRWQMYPAYAWRSFVTARRTRMAGVIRVVTTNPFFAPAMLARIGRGRGATINLVYDLYPEALIHAGVVAQSSWGAALCARITDYALRQCTISVFLGERLRSFAVQSGHCEPQRSAVIPVGADGGPFRTTPPQQLEVGQIPNVLYSGQMGRMHDTATLETYFATSFSHDVMWNFQATGSGYATLRQIVGDRQGVQWGSALSKDDWVLAMQQAQVALVTLSPGAERIVMPSKTYSALVAGQAILAICPRESDLADLIIRHDCGWVVEPGDAAGLSRAIGSIASDASGLLARRRRAYSAGHRFYDMRPISTVWLQVLNELRAPG